jgi:hypothetical protein
MPLNRLVPLVSLISCSALLAACVPSPTATPPLHTPFPTLPLPTDTPVPTVTLTSPPTLQPSPSATVTITLTRVAPSPTVRPTLSVPIDPLPPAVEIRAPDPSEPVSINQSVPLGLFAADNTGVVRIELFDNGILYNLAPAPTPAPRTYSTLVNWKSAQLGPHRLRVVGYDLAGNASAPADVTLNVITDNREPTVSITLPLGATDAQAGVPVLIQGVATDEAAIARVDLIVDDQLYTYLAPNDSQTASPFAVAFMWTPSGQGTHTVFLRAHDNSGQTADSAKLFVNIVDTRPPSVSASFERDTLAANGTLLVNALALSPSGLARIELWADNLIAQTVIAKAQGQTTLSTPLVWSADAIGDHTLFVRAYDVSGLNASTPPRVIHVRATTAGIAAVTNTPPLASANATAQLPTATPQVVVPPPPRAQLSARENPSAASLPGPIHIQLSAHGNVELDQVEVWAYYQGEANPQLLLGDSAKGATDKNEEFAWTPTHAGVAFLFARVFDSLGQVSKSPVLALYLVDPAAPTLTPAFFNLAHGYQADLPTGKQTMVLAQYGSALRGSFTNVPLNGAPSAGEIVSGLVTRDRASFSVNFPDAVATPRTLDFECALTTESPALLCNYQDETGARGSAVFNPVTSP